MRQTNGGIKAERAVMRSLKGAASGWQRRQIAELISATLESDDTDLLPSLRGYLNSRGSLISFTFPPGLHSHGNLSRSEFTVIFIS